MKLLALHLLPSELIRFSHTQVVLRSPIKFWTDLRLEVEAKLSHEQSIPGQSLVEKLNLHLN